MSDKRKRQQKQAQCYELKLTPRHILAFVESDEVAVMWITTCRLLLSIT